MAAVRVVTALAKLMLMVATMLIPLVMVTPGLLIETMAVSLMMVAMVAVRLTANWQVIIGFEKGAKAPFLRLGFIKPGVNHNGCKTEPL